MSPPAVNCDKCHLVMMNEHNELIFWLKCPSCGFCKENEEKLKRHPGVDKYMKKLDFLKNMPVKRPE